MLANNCAATGLAYALWLRLRWAIVGLLIYIAILAVSVQLFPLAAIGTLPVSALVAHLLTVFTFGPADLGVRGSGYPKSMMVLPLRTRSLVFWPMIYGAGTMALLWILVAALVLAPGGAPVPVLWPAALGAAATVWLQAIGWSPFPSPFARVPALALALTPLSLLGACAGMYLESWAVAVSIVFASFVWIAAAYFFAVQGLSRARAGNDGEWFQNILQRRMAGIRKRYASAGHVRPRFRSAAAAQIWHECRHNVMVLPLMIGFVGLPMLAMIVLAVLDGDVRRNVMFGSVVLSPAAMGLIMLAGGLLMLSGLFGPTFGKFDVWGKEQMPSFFAIRPMTTSRFVLIKVIASGLGALGAWAIVITLFCIWATVEASPLNARESLVRAALADASLREVILVSAVLLGLLAMSWREVANGLWISLTGRKWLAVSIGFTSMAVIGLAAVAGQWIYRHPEVQPRLIGLLPWLVGVLVILRTGSAAWALIALHKARLVPPRTMAIWLAVWLAAWAGLLAALSFAVALTPMLVAGIFFVLPLTRLAIAPLALHWNRHR